MAFVQNDH
jgi:hypothetical protein